MTLAVQLCLLIYSFCLLTRLTLQPLRQHKDGWGVAGVRSLHWCGVESGRARTTSGRVAPGRELSPSSQLQFTGAQINDYRQTSNHSPMTCLYKLNPRIRTSG
ncbi:hypothetical protein EV424DRAFT_1443814 [Suillus variegatus]|nr:hypothetical protein EV424DRAFT_1443814 [Suillus variegatus]